MITTIEQFAGIVRSATAHALNGLNWRSVMVPDGGHIRDEIAKLRLDRRIVYIRRIR